MSKWDLFNKGKAFLPVLHLPFGKDGALRSIETAVKAGADGVFLIDQGMTALSIRVLLPQIERRWPDLWVGVNFLSSSPEDIVRLPEADLIDGIWADDCGVDALNEAASLREAERWQAAKEENNWSGLYFGGTAFKTQAPIPDHYLGEVARRAASFVDVVTTSGRGTGVAAPVGKVAKMHQAVQGPNTPMMGLASGVTPENVRPMLPYVDAFLVATGIEKQWGELDPERTKLLADIIHGEA